MGVQYGPTARTTMMGEASAEEETKGGTVYLHTSQREGDDSGTTRRVKRFMHEGK